jgi:hypothetical protein
VKEQIAEESKRSVNNRFIYFFLSRNLIAKTVPDFNKNSSSRVNLINKANNQACLGANILILPDEK